MLPQCFNIADLCVYEIYYLLNVSVINSISLITYSLLKFVY